MPQPFTHLNLADVEDAAPGNGFGDRWEARVAREPLEAEATGVTHFRLRPGKRSPFTHRHTAAEETYVIIGGHGRMKLDDEIVEVRRLDAIRVPPGTARAFEAGDEGLEFIAFGPHHPGDGEPVDDPWTA
jgi:mannose-6-phosphate isomerase-like protein (cupin superfamily)